MGFFGGWLTAPGFPPVFLFVAESAACPTFRVNTLVMRVVFDVLCRVLMFFHATEPTQQILDTVDQVSRNYSTSAHLLDFNTTSQTVLICCKSSNNVMFHHFCYSAVAQNRVKIRAAPF